MKRAALLLVALALLVSGCGASDKLSGPDAQALATTLSCTAAANDTSTSADKVSCDYHGSKLGISTYATRGTFKNFLNAIPGQVLVGKNFIVTCTDASVLRDVRKVIGGQLTKD